MKKNTFFFFTTYVRTHNLMLLTWASEGLGRETSPDLSFYIGCTLGARCFHLGGTSNNPMQMGLDHVGLIKSSTTSSLIK